MQHLKMDTMLITWHDANFNIVITVRDAQRCFQTTPIFALIADRFLFQFLLSGLFFHPSMQHFVRWKINTNKYLLFIKASGRRQ